MNDNKISAKVLKGLEARATRLSEQVERATQASPDRDVRDGGSRLADVLEEWLQDIHEMHQADDEELAERVLSFRTRLFLAEKKVATWNVPAKRRTSKAPKERRRRTASRKAA